MIPSLVFAATFLIYFFSLSPNLPGGDAAELILAASTWGIVHPPGYPLYTVLGHGFAALPWGSAAWRLALFSAVAGAASAALLTAAALRLVRHPAAAVLAAALYALQPIVWKYSTQAEVFALNQALAAALVWLCVRLETTAENRRPMLFALGAVDGLVVSHHHTLVVFALIFSAGALRRERRSPALGAFFAGVAVGLLPLLYLPLAASVHPWIQWGATDTLPGFWRHLTRAEYGTFRLNGVGSVHPTPGAFFALFAREAGTLLWLGVIAAIGALRTLPTAARVGAGALLIYLTLLGVLANVPLSDAMGRETVQRVFLLGYLVFAALAALGFDSLFARLRLRPKWTAGIGWAAVALALSTLLVAERTRFRPATFPLLERFARAELDPLPPHAVVLTQGDLHTNALRYVQRLEGFRPDVTVIDRSMLAYRWYAPWLAHHTPMLQIPGPFQGKAVQGGYSIRDWLRANANQAIYASTFVTHYDDTESWPGSYHAVPFTTVFRFAAHPHPLDATDADASARAWGRVTFHLPPESLRTYVPPGAWEKEALRLVRENGSSIGLTWLREALTAKSGEPFYRATLAALGPVAAAWPDDVPARWKALAIAATELAEHDSTHVVEAAGFWREYTARTKVDDPDIARARTWFARRRANPDANADRTAF